MISNQTTRCPELYSKEKKVPALALPRRSPSLAAKSRLLSRRGEPLLIADWDRVLMMHYEVDAERLQRTVPFELDLWEGSHAFVSLVAFTMRGMRPRFGGRLGAWLLKPLATHPFLNVRTYVRHGDECGIHFLAEWLSNRLSVLVGPRVFGLPYRLGRLRYEHQHEAGTLRGDVEDARIDNALGYLGFIERAGRFAACAPGSLDEWLMERYTAFNAAGNGRRFFRVWHEPWPQTRVEIAVKDLSLLTASWPFFREARFIGANYSPGVCDVWMGRPHLL
jgi:uncharacterized protein YqjF (DUF2071 family)